MHAVTGGPTALALRYGWLIVPMLIPFLTGGVVVGDEAYLLKLAHGLDQSGLGFGDYVRGPDGWYISHHLLWFAVIYATAHVTAFLGAGALVTQAVISCQTVLAGLVAILLSYVFLQRRQNMDSARSLLVVLGFFCAGYGVFTFCMAGAVESYMALLMAARLFLTEPFSDTRNARQLAILDALLVALKAYSLIFLVFTWPLLLFSKKDRLVYALHFGALLLVLIGVKLWLWSPFYASAVGGISLSQSLSNFTEQFVSPWTGLPFCLPMLLVLFWSPRTQRRSLAYKFLGLCGCAAFFSLYSFFNGDIAGGRYIFPFTVALIPEIASAASRLLDRHRRAAWLLPLAVFAFLPVAAFGFPFFPDGSIPSRGACRPDHPVIYSWRVVVSKVLSHQEVEICFHRQNYVLSARDVASPHLAPWRVAYMLGGGHSPDYRAVAHNQEQQQHDSWGASLAVQLKGLGMGSPSFWMLLGLLPALLALWLSLWAAMRINSPVVAISDRA